MITASQFPDPDQVSYDLLFSRIMLYLDLFGIYLFLKLVLRLFSVLTCSLKLRMITLLSSWLPEGHIRLRGTGCGMHTRVWARSNSEHIEAPSPFDWYSFLTRYRKNLKKLVRPRTHLRMTYLATVLVHRPRHNVHQKCVSIVND